MVRSLILFCWLATGCSRVCGDRHEEWIGTIGPAIDAALDGGRDAERDAADATDADREVADADADPPQCLGLASPLIIDFDDSSTSSMLGRMLACDVVGSADGAAYQVEANGEGTITVSFQFQSCVDATAFSGVRFDVVEAPNLVTASPTGTLSVTSSSDSIVTDAGSCAAPSESCSAPCEDFVIMLDPQAGPLTLQIPFASLEPGTSEAVLDVGRIRELRWTFSGAELVRLDNLAFY